MEQFNYWAQWVLSGVFLSYIVLLCVRVWILKRKRKDTAFLDHEDYWGM